mgnify:CR=1 FL=1
MLLLNTKRDSFKTYKGIQELNSISQQVYGTSFKHLSDGNKILVRKQFISELRLLEQKYENIVVDGHYAFLIMMVIFSM